MNERARTVLGHHEREGQVLEEVQRPAPVRIHLACELRFRSFRVWGCKEEKHRGSGSRAARPAERRQLIHARASKKAGSNLGCLLKYSAAVEPTWRISDRQGQILVLAFWCKSLKPLKLFPLCSAAAGTTSARSRPHLARITNGVRQL